MTNQPVPQFDDPAGNDAQSGGPVWQTPAVDSAAGMLYANVGNPGPDADGSVRPGENRDTDSVVALDLATGVKKWAYLLDRTTGQPLPQFVAPETPVPQEATQGPTNPTQPIPTGPAFVPNGRGGTNINDC